MSLYNPPEPYFIDKKEIRLYDFYRKKEFYVKRPPYQRKAVWSKSKQRKLIDSFFRHFYVPNIVLRQVDFTEGRYKYEVVDGQQRIESIQNFFLNVIKLPKSLSDLTDDAGKYYNELTEPVRAYIDDLDISADIIRKIEDPYNTNNQKLVTDIFWRLQQGESLSYMEVEHSKISSGARNFVTKYSDEISFDWEKYLPLDHNEHRHPFFEIIDRSNERMEHLALLTRFLIIEKENGAADLSTRFISDFVDEFHGVDLRDFENQKWVKNCIKNLDVFHKIFEDDILIKSGTYVKELSREYFIISVYLLLRSLRSGDYTFTKDNYDYFKQFVLDFYQRWRRQDEDDTDIFIFRDYRQQDKESLVKRDQIMKKSFFEAYPDIIHTDSNRTFSEVDRIVIYRRDKGLCQECLRMGCSEEDAFIDWNEYEADHIIPFSKGGKTTLKNAQLLCKHHNAQLGSK